MQHLCAPVCRERAWRRPTSPQRRQRSLGLPREVHLQSQSITKPITLAKHIHIYASLLTDTDRRRTAYRLQVTRKQGGSIARKYHHSHAGTSRPPGREDLGYEYNPPYHPVYKLTQSHREIPNHPPIKTPNDRSLGNPRLRYPPPPPLKYLPRPPQD